MSEADKIRRKVNNAVWAAAATIEKNAKLAIQHAPRGGKNLNKMKERRSAPGEPPATELGNLVNSIQSEKQADGILVFVGAEYGADLEYGTKKMAPRPFWNKAVKDGEAVLKKKLEK